MQRKLKNSVFKWEICSNTFKKEITLKKHVNTKHWETFYKVLNKVFKTLIEVVQHIYKENSTNTEENNSVNQKEREEQIKDDEIIQTKKLN